MANKDDVIKGVFELMNEITKEVVEKSEELELNIEDVARLLRGDVMCIDFEKDIQFLNIKFKEGK